MYGMCICKYACMHECMYACMCLATCKLLSKTSQWYWTFVIYLDSRKSILYVPPYDLYSAVSYVSIVVDQIIGEPEFVEGDRLTHPLKATCWRVRVDVYPAGQLNVRLSRNHPTGTVEAVSEPLVFTGDEVYHQYVVGCWIQSGQLDLKTGEHPPTQTWNHEWRHAAIHP